MLLLFGLSYSFINDQDDDHNCENNYENNYENNLEIKNEYSDDKLLENIDKYNPDSPSNINRYDLRYLNNSSIEYFVKWIKEYEPHYDGKIILSHVNKEQENWIYNNMSDIVDINWVIDTKANMVLKPKENISNNDNTSNNALELGDRFGFD
tara:strand:+ start:2093 stop:2548 length:456 start_codon:yes stop_codon:yes gene_type:complete